MTFYLSLHNGTLNGKTFQEKTCLTLEYWATLLGIENRKEIIEASSYFFKKIEFTGTPIRVNGRWGKGSDELFDVMILPNENKNYLIVKDNNS